MSYIVRCDCGRSDYVGGRPGKLEVSASRKDATRFETREDALAAYTRLGITPCKPVPVVEEVPEC